MGAFIDLTGQRFGHLTVLQQKGHDHTNVTWLCKCDCGKEKTVNGRSLRIGRTTSCGCSQYKWLKTKKIAEHHGGSRTKQYGGKERLYRVWLGMRQRCNNPNCNRYSLYGGRGISICSEWNDYSVFRGWAMEHGYNPEASRGECTIDRIDVNGNYEPSNCRWVNMKTQRENQRKEV